MKLTSVQSRTFLIGVFMLLFLAGFIYFSYRFTLHIELEGRMIDLAGSERMRAFEISFHLNKLSENREFNYSEVKTHVRDFEEIIYALRDGSKKRGLPPPTKLLSREDVQNSFDIIITRWNNEIRPNVEKALDAFAHGDYPLSRSYIKEYDSIIHKYVVTDINRLLAVLEKDIERDTREYITLLIMFLGIMGIITFAVYLWFMRTTVKPILRLSAITTGLGKGDLTARIEGYKRDDEIGELAASFNKMADSLEKRTTEIYMVNDELKSELYERKQAEKALLGSNKRYSSIFGNSIEGIYQSTPEGQFITANPAMAHILGYDSPDDLINTVTDIQRQTYVNPEDRARFMELAEKKDSIKGFEAQFYRKDGSVIWISLNTRVVRDTNGDILFYEGFLEDITEHKQAEETLKRYSEELEERVGDRTRELESANTELKKIFNAIEQAAEAIMITDINGTIQYSNPAFSLITGYSREDAIGQNPRILKSGKNPTEMYTNLWNTILAGNIWKSTTINKKKSGELYYEEMTITPVLDEHGEIINFVAIKKDVTDRVKAAEELRQKNVELEAAKDMAEAANRAKSEFLANMSHELRTPLNAVIGFSQVILDGMAGPVTDAQKEYTNDILESGRHLLSIITEILDLSRIEAGKEELEITEFPLEALIKESLMMFHEKAIKHNIKLTTDVAEDIGSIKADARKIKQVVINLLSNAIKFTPDGGEVTVQARKIHDAGYTMQNKEKGFNIVHPESGIMHPDGDFVEISVADTGIGIKEEDMQRLFRPFEQLEKHLTKQYAGTGLGLTLCKKFVEMHEGRIWAESEFGKGSRFIFIIPVRQV